ncbi:MAG: 2-oxoacid:acceptor oxidoreductase family protein [Thermoprotei archaeon]
MKHELLIVGRGGQGILLLGRVLGTAIAKYTDLHVASTETYGAETRGTESRVDMIIADNPDEIDYIKARKPTIALFMYPFNLDYYIERLSDNAIVFLNTTHVKEFPQRKNWVVYGQPYTDIADRETGTVRTANMVALGHIIAKTKLVDPKHVEETIKEAMPSKWIDINLKAFRIGLNLP